MSHPRFLLVLAGCLILANCAPPELVEVSQTRLAGSTMGTTYHIVISPAVTDAEQTRLQQEVDLRLEHLNDLMSTYRPDSELSRFNRRTELDWFPVSSETALVVARSLEISTLSHGAFDATVGPVVRLWNFGPDPGPDAIPPQTNVDQELARVGYQRIEVRLEPPALRKERPDGELHLSALAKGYAVDAVLEVVRPAVGSGCLVEIGGEIRTVGTKADGSPWKVAIERPTAGRRDLQETLRLTDAALATSGDYRNFVEIAGVRYSHTIDPITGRPVAHRLSSASVLANNCMDADALATALMVLGPEKGYDWAEKHGLAALLLVPAGDNFRELVTPEWTRRVATNELRVER